MAGGLAGFAAGEGAGVVLDAGAVAELAELFHVVAGAGAEPLRLQQFPLLLKLRELLVELLLDFVHGFVDAALREDEVLGGVDVGVGLRLGGFAGDGLDDGEAFDLVAPELDAVGELLVGGPDFDDVAAHAEAAAREFDVVALVLDVDELHEQLVAIDPLADAERNHHFKVVFRRAEAVDAGDAGDDDDIAAADERARGEEAEAVDLLVDGGVFFDVDVALGDVGLRLVVVVVADEVGDGVVGKELAELAVELGGEGFVVGEDERGSLQLGDDVRHGERFAGAGGAEEDLALLVFPEAADEGFDRGGLIAGGGEFGLQFKSGHGGSRVTSVQY